jgi:DHA1 family bicyclomycin/chloramphenicol resistance-like MFS transporter
MNCATPRRRGGRIDRDLRTPASLVKTDSPDTHRAAIAGPPLWLLALITISGAMAMHMFVPALPDAALALQATPASMQMAISIYIVGLAVGQLAYGPLSDAYGWRRLLMAGLALYVAGGVACALATGVNGLLAGRLVQALGGCAGLSLGRAMVRDTAPTESAVRELALLNLMVLLGPGIASVVGGVLTATAGWRSIVLLLAAVGAATLVFCWRTLPETTVPACRFGARVLVSDYRALLGSRRFVGFAVGGGCATTSLYAFLSAAPFIFIDELHQSVDAGRQPVAAHRCLVEPDKCRDPAHDRAGWRPDSDEHHRPDACLCLRLRNR